MKRIKDLPSNSLSRKVHEFSRRAHSAINHARIMIEIKKLQPYVLKSSSVAKETLLSQLDTAFVKVLLSGYFKPTVFFFFFQSLINLTYLGSREVQTSIW